MHHKNILDALKEQRPTDKIVGILSKKVALSRSMYTDGTYDKPVLMVLRDGKVYSACYPEDAERYIKYLLNIPKFEPSMRYIGDGKYRRIMNDNRAFIKRHRQFAHTLQSNGIYPKG